MSVTVFTRQSIRELPFLGADTEGDVRLNANPTALRTTR